MTASSPATVSQTSRPSVARSALWTLLESAGLSGLSVVALIVISRYLSPSDFGVASAALGVVQMLVMLVERLFHDPLVQRIEVSPIDIDTAFTATLSLGVLLTGLCWVLAPLYARHADQPSVGPVLQWMSLSVVTMSIGSVLVALHRRALEFRVLALRSLAARLLSAFVAIGMAIAGAGVWSLVAQQVLIVGLSSAVLWLLADGRRPRLALRWASLRSLLSMGGPSLMQQFVAFSVPRVYIVIFSALLGSVATGFISLGFRVIDMLRELVGSAVSQLALPVFARIEREGGDRGTALFTAMRLTTSFAFPIFATLAALSPDLVEVVFGKAWLPAVPYVALLALLTFHFFPRLFMTPMLTALGRPALPMLGMVVQLGTVVGLMYALGQRSPAWAAGIWAFRLLAALPVDMVTVKRVAGVGYIDQWRGCFVPATAALGMAAALWGMRMLLSVEHTAALARLVGLSVCAPLIYLALLWLLDRALLRDIQQFALAALHRKR